MNPVNPLVKPILTDLYELTMAYAYWKSGRHEDRAVFDLFFRKNPFHGEYTVFAGLEEVVAFLENFRFEKDDIKYIQASIPEADAEFAAWLSGLDCSEVTLFAPREGTLVFPLVPMLRVEGPLGVTQLLETTLLNLVNYPSLIATNAMRMRRAAGEHATLIEFGLRRAQGPDGGLSASRYSYLGAFDATSNMLAGKLFDISVKGTLAHSFVTAFSSFDELQTTTLKDADGQKREFLDVVQRYRQELGYGDTNDGELTAFVAYAQAFPNNFLALVDTYNTLRSGVPNFLCVALALHELGFEPVGLRLDSGDLAYLSKKTREMLCMASGRYNVSFDKLAIVASNDIDEQTLYSLGRQGHEIDVFGVGTHLVTCETTPALGGVYKLVELNGEPKIKISQDPGKVTIPGRKDAYRLIGERGYPLLDLMLRSGEDPPAKGRTVLCRHPYDESKRLQVTPSDVIPLYDLVWQGRRMGGQSSLKERRVHAWKQVASFRPDHLRELNPTPYKVSLSDPLYRFMHKLWLEESPVAELR